TTGGKVLVFTAGTKVPAKVRSVTFTFGDRTPAVHRTRVPARIGHVFTKLGRHTVTMRIVDRLGRVARASRTVVVSAKPNVPDFGLGMNAPTDNIQPDTTLRTADTLPASVDLRSDALTPGMQSSSTTRIGSCVTWAIHYGLL